MTPIVARSVPANQGVRFRYQRRMLALIRAMVADVERSIRAAYQAAPPAMALDAPPVRLMQREMTAIGAKWIKRFDDAAPLIAGAYVKGSFKATDGAFRQALKDAGWLVKLEMTPAMQEAFEASLAENVGLIKSIPEQYLRQVEGAVMRSYARGRDLEYLVNQIKRIYPRAANRAVFIARDQSNKANAVVTQARQLELGIREAVWMHSHAGKTPRPTHVAMNGKTYPVAKGMWDSAVRRYIFPGEEPNCRCTGRSVLPFATN